METIEIEFHQIELKYQQMSIVDPKAQSKLISSLVQQGQHSPVLVVNADTDKYILIDGYRRVKALKKLNHDTVKAVIGNMNESEALLVKYRMDNRPNRTALEESWLLHELIENHGLSQEELAERLERSRSWICRRLALVNVLSEKLQKSVRNGKISPQVAMKYLVPLARANRKDCEILVENLKGKRITVRQGRALYIAWCSGDAEQKKRIISDPLMYLKAHQVLEETRPKSSSKHGDLIQDIEIIGSVCRRACLRISQGSLGYNIKKDHLYQVWLDSCNAFDKLKTIIGRGN